MHKRSDIEKQNKIFQAKKKFLSAKYEGKYVLFENGKVLDSGETRAEVAMRAYKSVGMRPLFIEKVTSTPEEPETIWTPFT
ncbi:MAG: DUF5678 domain-containing protein [Leptolyngbyaceae cyanobacterium]